MNTLLSRAPFALGRWVVGLTILLWATVPLSVLIAIDPSRIEPRWDLTGTIFGTSAVAAMGLVVTTATLARPRWTILPSQRVEWTPAVEWLRRVLRRPAGPAKARVDEADRAITKTVEALQHAAEQPWFHDAQPIIEATMKRAAAQGRMPNANEMPDPFFDLTLEDVARHGFATDEQIATALAQAGTLEPPPGWLAAYERGEGDGRGWSRRELLARIGLRAAWETGHHG